MANVTVLGTGGSTVNIPFASADNAAAAQAALNSVNRFIALGADDVVDIPSGTAPLPPASGDFAATVGEIGQLNGSAQGQLPIGYTTLINTSSNLVAYAGAEDTTLVESGGNGIFFYANTALNARVFLGGGVNDVFNAFDGTSMTVNVDGPTSPGGAGAAIIDGAYGSTTVNLFDGGLADVLQGDVSVIAQPGTTVVEVSAPSAGSTDVVTVSGMAGSLINYIPGGGNAFITPGAADVIVLGSTLGGSETLFGGTAVVNGQTLTGPAFTGKATVAGGTGYFQGGSAGGNLLISSSVAGAATLVGGGNGDLIGAYGANDLLIAGVGNETLTGGLGSTSSLPGSGLTFVTGDASAQDLVVGDGGGNDTIKLGSGSATIGLGHMTAAGNGFTDVVSGNTIVEQAGISGGNVTVNAFLPQAIGFAASDVVSLNSGVTAQLAVVGGDTVATLSDGTKITFSGVNGTPNSGSGLSITNHGSFLS